MANLIRHPSFGLLAFGGALASVAVAMLAVHLSTQPVVLAAPTEPGYRLPTAVHATQGFIQVRNRFHDQRGWTFLDTSTPGAQSLEELPEQLAAAAAARAIRADPVRFAAVSQGHRLAIAAVRHCHGGQLRLTLRHELRGTIDGSFRVCAPCSQTLQSRPTGTLRLLVDYGYVSTDLPVDASEVQALRELAAVLTGPKAAQKRYARAVAGHGSHGAVLSRWILERLPWAEHYRLPPESNTAHTPAVLGNFANCRPGRALDWPQLYR